MSETKVTIGLGAIGVMGLDDLEVEKALGVLVMYRRGGRRADVSGSLEKLRELAEELAERAGPGWALEPAERAAARRGAASIRRQLEASEPRG